MATKPSVTRKSKPQGASRLDTKYDFIPPSLAGAKIHRVLAVLPGRVIAEFARGPLRLRRSLEVPDADLADFLMDCEARGALKGLLVRPAFISNSIPKARTIERLLGSTGGSIHFSRLP